MESKESINKLNIKAAEVDTSELDSDDTINAAIKSLSLESINKLNIKAAEVDTSELDSDDTINAAIKSLSLVGHSRSKMDSSLKPGIPGYPKINQNVSETTINAFCPTCNETKQEESLSHVVPRIKPILSLSSEPDQTLHVFCFVPSEVLHVMSVWNKHMSPVALTNPWNEDIISKSLTDMEISASQKRKREIENFSFPFIPNKRMLREKILEGVIEIEPGIWKSTGSGLIENDEVAEFAFAPGFNEGPSKIIFKVKKQYKGKAKGSRRLNGIKQAAREKFVRENIRKFDDETGLLEFGRDPFGKHIINIPSFTLFPSLSLTEIDDIQCDEDAKFSLFANDFQQCHSREK
ncbi:hypothetical protein V6N13_049207 [Hibiscus sabdariffa]|uniref:Uncharacterized protein n=1 Tax=Hibiscus sabdariffa TaxID=183260 RepID=A0ABR2QYJ3_9ROSI